MRLTCSCHIRPFKTSLWIPCGQPWAMHWSRCKIRLGWERHRCQWMGFQHQLMGLTFLVGCVGRGLAVLSARWTTDSTKVHKLDDFAGVYDKQCSNNWKLEASACFRILYFSWYPADIMFDYSINRKWGFDYQTNAPSRGFNFKKGSRDASTQSSLAITTREMFYNITTYAQDYKEVSRFQTT